MKKSLILVSTVLLIPAFLSAEQALPENVRLLKERLENSQSDLPTRLEAIKALGRAGAPSLPVLKEVVESYTQFQKAEKVAAIEALACTEKSAVPILKKVVESDRFYEDQEVKAAVYSLRHMGAEAVPVLRHVIEYNSGKFANVTTDAIRALGYVGPEGKDRAVEILKGVLDNGFSRNYHQEKLAALEALGRVGTVTPNPCRPCASCLLKSRQKQSAAPIEIPSDMDFDGGR